MNTLIYLFISITSWASPPVSFPIFVKMGHATILEFDEAPDLIVLGDRQSFHVSKIRNVKLEVDALVSTATSNLFVYFKRGDPRLFSLTASEDAVPTYYKKFDTITAPPLKNSNSCPLTPVYNTGGKALNVRFDGKKDYLSVEVELKADSKTVLKPIWEKTSLILPGITIVPNKLWSERKEVQRDSRIRARFIFAKPNVPRNLHGANLVIPLYGSINSIKINLEGRAN